MAAGFLHGAKCYASTSDATSAYFGSFVPQVVPGATSYAVEFSNVGGVWKTNGYTINASGVWSLRYSSNAIAPAFPACDTTEQFFDGMVIGWAIAASMALAWGARQIRAQIR